MFDDVAGGIDVGCRRLHGIINLNTSSRGDTCFASDSDVGADSRGEQDELALCEAAVLEEDACCTVFSRENLLRLGAEQSCDA
jgi:hypothetical protein